MQRLSRRRLLGLMGTGAAGIASRAVWTPASATVPAVGATPVAEFESTVADQWLDVLRTLVRQAPGYSPPVAARAFGCVGVTLYEALVPGMPGHRSLVGLLNDLPASPSAGQSLAYHWPTVANAALAEAIRSLMPAGPALQEVVGQLEHRFAAEFGRSTPRGVHRRSSERGTAVAQAVAAWARTDGGHEAYLRNFPADYVAPQGPGMWTPTPPAFQRALQPRWGSNRCFLLPSADDCIPGPPPAFSTVEGSAFHTEAAEVFDTVDRLTDEQLSIARFWSDDPGLTATPPGHSVSILTQVLRQGDASLEQAAEAYARVGIAVTDAFVACWQAKFRYNLLRPISYIRAHIEPTWGDAAGSHPVPLVTPPFPEYTSGHSAQSGAAAVVLTELFGARPFTDHTHEARGLPSRSFASFSAAAEEAAMSRLYGGIHFRSGVERGLEQGRCIGAHVAALPLRS